MAKKNELCSARIAWLTKQIHCPHAVTVKINGWVKCTVCGHIEAEVKNG
jgi:hypothetical protein